MTYIVIPFPFSTDLQPSRRDVSFTETVETVSVAEENEVYIHCIIVSKFVSILLCLLCCNYSIHMQCRFFKFSPVLLQVNFNS